MGGRKRAETPPPMVQHGRRTGSSKKESSTEEAGWTMEQPDRRQAIILTEGDWQTIQDILSGVNRDEERMKAAEKEREALYLKSKEAVKQWPDTFARRRQKKLEAKQIREEMEEEKRKLVDKEEAEYQEQQRKEAIEKAKAQLYYQTPHVKELHRALLHTEVLKEREAQIELKQKIKSTTEDVNKAFLDMMKTREDEAWQKEEEKVLQNKIQRQAASEDLKSQIREKELMHEQDKIEAVKKTEERQRLQELYQQQQRMEEEREAKMKRDVMHTYREQVTTKEIEKATELQKEEDEEEQRKLYRSKKQKMAKLRKEKEEELSRHVQMRRERVVNNLKQLEKADDEEQRIAEAVAEYDAKLAQRLREEEEKRAAMLESIAAHRESVRQEKEQRDEAAKQNNKDALQAKREACRMFHEKQQLKAQRAREEARKQQVFNAAQTAEKNAKRQQERREEYEFVMKNAELNAEEENKFQQYSQQLISAAAEGQRNVFLLCKASGALTQDSPGAQMPKYVSGTRLLPFREQQEPLKIVTRPDASVEQQSICLLPLESSRMPLLRVECDIPLGLQEHCSANFERLPIFSTPQTSHIKQRQKRKYSFLKM